MTDTLFPVDQKRLDFLYFMQRQHDTNAKGENPQIRKYTGENYWNHPIEVANEVFRGGYNGLEIEIALGHDLFEDTYCTEETLRFALNLYNYKAEAIDKITQGIWDLTDRFDKEQCPELNRRTRKLLERDRLSEIAGNHQTVKYCDNICNAESIFSHDKDFAIVYCKEMKLNLATMNKGDRALFDKINSIIDQHETSKV